ncbi:MAG TPA: hypothetical protein VFE05_14245 [Longimicrobiaceae bacterium]|nr:hypothetical protein [Longimicrobiaceae bacterium]
MKLGFSGWGAIATAGVSSYQMFQARQTTAERYSAYIEYNNAHYSGGPYDPLVEKLLYQQVTDARSAENALWLQVGVSSGIALGAIGAAAAVCWPIAIAPEP